MGLGKQREWGRSCWPKQGSVCLGGDEGEITQGPPPLEAAHGTCILLGAQSAPKQSQLCPKCLWRILLPSLVVNTCQGYSFLYSDILSVLQKMPDDSEPWLCHPALSPSVGPHCPPVSRIKFLTLGCLSGPFSLPRNPCPPSKQPFSISALCQHMRLLPPGIPISSPILPSLPQSSAPRPWPMRSWWSGVVARSASALQS